MSAAIKYEKSYPKKCDKHCLDQRKDCAGYTTGKDGDCLHREESENRCLKVGDKVSDDE